MEKQFKIFKNKKILITGHTGFKGSWLSLWLSSIGAKVYGISLKTKNFNHFNSLKIRGVRSNYFDIKNQNKIRKAFKKIKPDFVFHLAAQALVKRSYVNSTETFLSNSIGTLNILEGLKCLKNNCTAVIITSDKVYKNFEVRRGYKENDIIGGQDPYSASKGCAELIIESYFSSFLKKNKNLRIAVARAGNVIGGGDWSQDRLIPDCAKSWKNKKPVILRNPNSTRPWQNVLDVLRGYMILAKNLNTNSKLNGKPFNFGPQSNENYAVKDVIKILKKNWNKFNFKIKKSKKNYKEANLLKLNSSKANKILKWKSVLKFNQSVELTANWYKNYFNTKNVKKTSLLTLENYYYHLNKQKV
jgi:CDP-glucose 4,6-dehydratase